MAIIKVKTAGVDDTINLGRRNLIINGAMQVAQRGSSFTSIDGYGLDRHITDVFGGSSAAFNAEQSTDAPDGFLHSYKVTVATAETPSGSDATSIFQHRIEGQNLQHLGWGDSSVKHITLSFYVKSSLTGDFPFGLEIYCSDIADNTGYMASYTINSANTWEYKTIKIPLFDNSVSVVSPKSTNEFGALLRFGGGGVGSRQGVAGWQSRSTSLTGLSGTIAFAANSGATWQITGVQLEVGDTATPFEHRLFAEELQLCYRYYRVIGEYGDPFKTGGTGYFLGHTGSGMQNNENRLAIPYLETTMRTAPSVTHVNFSNGGTGALTEFSSGTVRSQIGIYDISPNGGGYAQFNGNFTNPVRYRAIFDAEL